MSTREEKIQLATEVDSSGALQGLKRIEDGAAGMARAVSDSASKAGAGIDAMGASGAQASAKLEGVTRSIAAQIQRVTAAAEAGEKGTAKYFESLARMRGADVNALQPYLQQLEQARQRTDGLTISTGQYTNALRMVPAQMTDIVTSLASGQDPLLVLIQQGGQLKDQFGGVGAAAKAIGGYVVGLVNPITVVAAAAGGLALAFESGRRESAALSNILIQTGNAAGVTVGQLNATAAAIDGIVSTQGRAAEVLGLLAQAGVRGRTAMQEAALAALNFERAGGQAAEETVKQFAELGRAPVEAVAKLNEGMNFLTLATYEQIKSLSEQGRVTEAAAVAQKAFADTLDNRAALMSQNLGLVERGWRGISSAVAEAWDAIKNIGRVTGPEGQLAAASTAASYLQQQIDARRSRGLATGDLDRQLAAAREFVETKSEEVRLAGRAAAAEAERVRIQKEGIAASEAINKSQERGLPKQQQLNKALDDYREGLDKIRAANPESALLNPERVAAGEKAIRELFKDTAAARVNAENMQIAALRSKAVAEEEALRRLQVYGLQADKLTDGEREVLRLQEQIAVATDGRAKSVLQAELAEARRVATAQRAQVVLRESLQLQRDQVDLGDKQLAAIYQDTASIERKAMALEAENEAWGKSRVAIEAAVLARMQANAADVALFDGSAQVVAALNAKTDAQRRYVEALQAAELKTFNQRGDEMLRQAQELRDTYADELQLVGLSAVERDKIVAVRQVELKYAKLIADVERSSLSDAEKRAQVGKLVEAQGVESSAVVNRVMQQDFARTAAQIEQSLTDALMRGFESGKGFGENLRDTLVNMFKTLVLRPVIQATVQGGLNAIGLGGQQQGGGAMGTVSNLSSLYSTGSAVTGFASGMLSGASEAALGASFVGPSAALAPGATGFGASFGATSFGSALSSIPGWGWAAMAALALISSLDDSGTYHTGGAGSYSDAQGLRSGQSVDGLDFRPSEYKEAIATGSAAFAKGLVGVLDSTAKNFGKEAGYWAATGFADDSSKDGAWGALSIMRDGKSVLDWGNGADKWPGREFKDGEKGYTEYLNAVAGDVRDLLIESTPDWADAMLEGLGDSVTMEQLAAKVGEINRVQAALVSLGDVMPQLASLSDEASTALLGMFDDIDSLAAAAGSYYENFYTDAERAAITTQQVTDTLGELGLSMPTTRAQYRALVEAQDLSTASGRETYAALLKLAPAFASVTDAAKDATAAAEEQAKAAMAAADSAYQVLSRAVDAERQALQRQLSLVSDSVSDLTGLFSTIRGGLDTLYGGVESVAAMRAQEARGFIAQAASTARTTGYLPEADALQQAIDAVGADPTVYASRVDAERARLQTAAQLAALGELTGDQLDTATQQLRALERQIDQNDMLLEAAQAQLNALKGIDTTVLSVSDALRLFYERTFELGEFAPEVAASTGTTKAGSGGFTLGGGTAAPVYATDGERLAAEMAAYEAAGKAYRLTNLPGAGLVVSAAAGEQQDLTDQQREWLRKAGVPGFAGGGDHFGGVRIVGERGPELEFTGPSRIVNAENTRRLLQGVGTGANTARLEAQVASLVAEMQALREQVREGNRHALRTANATNGNPENPMPVEAVN